MCLILIAHQYHPDLPLVVAANRDEYHARPARAARFWPEQPGLLAGKDLSAGGTWLGIHRNGRFAAVTNFREPGLTTGEWSRGALCTHFLQGEMSAEAYIQQLTPDAHRYGGFNLVIGEGGQLWYFSNQEMRARQLSPGIYGVSNGLIDEPWPKVVSGKRVLATMLTQGSSAEAYLEMLADRFQPDDRELPSTGVSLTMERLLAPRFICSAEYGTRVSTALLVNENRAIAFTERSYNRQGQACGQVAYTVAGRTDTSTTGR